MAVLLRSTPPRPQGAPERVAVLPALPWRTGLLVTLFVLAWLALSEVDRLSGQIPARDGRVHPLSELVGLRTSVSVWRVVLSDAPGALVPLLVAHVVADLLFVVGYAWLGWRLTRRSRGTARLGGALLVTAAIDVIENAVIAIVGFLDDPGALLPFLVLVTWLKWGAVLVTAGLAIRALQRRWGGVVAWWRTARFAIRIQRFGVLVLAVLVLLSLVPRDGVFDQLPDVQRSWPESATGMLHLAAAVVVLLVTAAALFVMGRLRTQHLLDEQERGQLARQPYPLYLWFIGPLVLWILALLQPQGVLWGRLALATAVLIVVGLASFVLRCGRERCWFEAGRPLDRPRIEASAQLGDLTAVGLVAASGLGLVRAFVGPLVLGLAPVAGTVFLIFGMLTALAVWPVAAGLIDRLGRSANGRWWQVVLIPRDPVHWRGAVIPVATTVTGLVMLAVASSPGVGGLGVSATVMLATGLIALFVGGMVVLSQDCQPPEALGILGFRTTPVVLLLVTLLVIANLSPANTQLHGLRRLSDAVPDRPELGEAFSAWLTATEGCGREGPDGTRWRPLVLYAAEGGGIRAAYWTARSIDLIGGGDPRCAAAFLSGGASGGAVGLTVSQVSQPGRAADAVTALSRSDALAQASLGMFLRDVLRAGTGLPFATSPDAGWQDRAALIEEAWEEAVPALDSAYLNPEPPGRTGSLVLNTTAVSSGCRTFLSQVQLTDTPNAARPGECDGRQAPGGRSVDLFARDAEERCVGSPRASTAALMASRFPYVTPAAAIGCQGQDLDQLVDGGYVENSGLGTLVDLWPELSVLVRAHNEAAGPGDDRVVPFVVYLTNSPGADLAPPGRPITAELFVPPVAYLRSGGAQSSPAALLQRLRGATDQVVGGTPPAGSTTLPEQRVFVVYPATRPAISAPLGWTLSGMSRTSMDDALDQQMRVRCGEPGVRSRSRELDTASVRLICERGYGTLGDLVGALRG